MKLVRFLLSLAGATLLHAFGAHLFDAYPSFVDLFLVVAVLHCLDTPPGWGMIGGSATGLVRDALSGGLYGLHGFANTLVAYVAARLQQRLVIQQPLQIGILLVLMAALQLAILATLQFFLFPGAELPDLGTMIARMASCGFLGSFFFVLIRRFRSSERKWREQRSRRLTLVSK